MDNWTSAFIALAYINAFIRTRFLEIYVIFLAAICMGPSMHSGNTVGVLVGFCAWSLIASAVFLIVPPQREG